MWNGFAECGRSAAAMVAKNKTAPKSVKSHAVANQTQKAPGEALLGMACEMAWRIACTDPQFLNLASKWAGGWAEDALSLGGNLARRERQSGSAGKASEQSISEMGSSLIARWDNAVSLAHRLITRCRNRLTTDMMISAAHDSQLNAKIAHYFAFLDSGALTSSEKDEKRVSFRRGCKLITGLADGPDAERRFQRVFPHLARREEGFMQLEHYQKHGFFAGDVGVIRGAWGRLPQEILRKPYEKTGRYRRNKQGREKKPKK
jgi:hypothetical protein